MSVDNVVTIAGIIITGIFSLLVWLATKATANVAKETLKLNERIFNEEQKREKEFNSRMRSVLKNSILNESKIAWNAVSQTEITRMSSKTHSAPEKLSIDKNEMAQHFTNEEIKVTFDAWDSFRDFKLFFPHQMHYSDEITKLQLQKATPIAEKFTLLIQKLTNE